MLLYPEQTCLLCDLPWKNNRVRYDGTLALDSMSRCLVVGDTILLLDADGTITLGKEIIKTGFPANEASIALDTLHKLLYFGSENRIIAYDLEKEALRFFVKTKETAGAPLLFEWLMPDGSVQEAIGFSDGGECFHAHDRVTGQKLWCAQILGKTVDSAAHWYGYLYMTLAGEPCQVLCLEADTGDLVWWNRGTGIAKGGVICKDEYCVLSKDGVWQRFSIIDGERLA